jgi:cold-inducible RNA-binding protein
VFGIESSQSTSGQNRAEFRKKDREKTMKKLYVGNLPYSATESELNTLFSEYGEVSSVAVVTDRETGRPRGFGFVEMDAAGATKAIGALNNKDFNGRTLTVNEARPRAEGGGGGGGGRSHGNRRW